MPRAAWPRARHTLGRMTTALSAPHLPPTDDRTTRPQTTMPKEAAARAQHPRGRTTTAQHALRRKCHEQQCRVRAVRAVNRRPHKLLPTDNATISNATCARQPAADRRPHGFPATIMPVAGAPRSHRSSGRPATATLCAKRQRREQQRRDCAAAAAHRRPHDVSPRD